MCVGERIELARHCLGQLLVGAVRVIGLAAEACRRHWHCLRKIDQQRLAVTGLRCGCLAAGLATVQEAIEQKLRLAAAGMLPEGAIVSAQQVIQPSGVTVLAM